MASDAYLKLLRDPRWQRKRLEILERDGWACTFCEATDRTLHIHHRRYQWGKKPWEYADDDLTTLCEVCHALSTAADKALKATLVHLDTGDLSFLAGVAVGLRIRTGWCKDESGTGALAPWARDVVHIVDYEMASGIGSVVKMAGPQIAALIEGGTLDLERVAALMVSRF